MLSTRKKIVVIADQLIRMKGYNAFSYADIASTLNIKNAAIHYHFQSKAVLGKAVIIASRDKFKENTTLWDADSSFDQVTAFIEMYSNNRKNNCICFMGALGSSFNTLPEEMKIELTDAHNEITVWLINILKLGKEQQEIDFDTSAEEMSDLITSGMLASLILDRVSKNSVLDNVKRTLLKRIEKKN
ncbi:MAG: TetR/AcrR family transcriptional repressor of nem operon [Crocinitomix sp.]|jgi:TetR/AcrR family transcriptional repressor of nem operon